MIAAKGGSRAMNTNDKKVLSRGSYYSKRDCPDNPRPKKSLRAGAHFFVDVSRRPSGHPGESLITSRCKYCGGLIVDCPTIGIPEFSL
jgi:hypothetical protein